MGCGYNKLLLAKIVQTMLPKVNPTQTSAWSALKQHFNGLEDTKLQAMFDADPERYNKFSHQFKGILWDFSKNLINEHTLELLEQLFTECGLSESVLAQFNGEFINETENRAVLHTALRNFSDRPVVVDGRNVMPDVHKELEKMRQFSQKLGSSSWLGYTGKPITDIVNIGIGGSDLGPAMMYEALRPYHLENLDCHFVSNVDEAHIHETLKNLDRETTLFIIASKTFTTQETMTNAMTARAWFLKEAEENAISRHFVAVSTNEVKVSGFGIDPQNMFIFWDWVGGRYSVWSAIGLSLCCGIGYDNFEQLLRGAHSMDEHFRSKDFHENIPMLMAAIGIWYVNFWDAESEAIIPYQQNLSRFAAYFQQGNMESNGKSVDRGGEPVGYQTGPIVWGEPGTNGQHAFFQLIHQGTRLIPCDFIGFAQSSYPDEDHQNKLMANFFAQTEALMQGRTLESVAAGAQAGSLEEQQIPYRIFEGGKPTTSILGTKLDPFTLGVLVAAYEHKIFVQGVIWNIYSYDQWGVELGKKLANLILPELESDSRVSSHDASTNGLINYYLSQKKPKS